MKQELTHKMKLNILERTEIPGLFPQTGDRFEVATMHEIVVKVAVRGNEATAIKFQKIENPFQGTTQYYWDETKEGKPKTFEFTKDEIRFMQQQVTLRHERKTLSKLSHTLCDKLEAIKLPGEKK